LGPKLVYSLIMKKGLDEHIMSHVVHLGKGVYIGPMPKLYDDVYYLKNKLGISCIVNLLPLKPEESWDGKTPKSESYKKYFDTQYMKLIHHELNMDKLSHVFAQKIKDKQVEEARNFIKVGEKIKSLLEEQGAKKIFIHYQTGFKEEVIVGFILLKLLYPESAPGDPCTWITDNQYNMLLADSGDSRELMLRIYKEMDELKKGLTKFFIKKAKTSGV